MSFYHYSQNNSGGGFVYDKDRGISHHVVIEAASAEEADMLAESIGLYFDGDGDCPCCGDRWSNAYGEGDPVPSVYSEPLTDAWRPSYGKWIKGPECYVHYLSGAIMAFGV